jgi:hypothetical protein
LHLAKYISHSENQDIADVDEKTSESAKFIKLFIFEHNLIILRNGGRVANFNVVRRQERDDERPIQERSLAGRPRRERITRMMMASNDCCRAPRSGALKVAFRQDFLPRQAGSGGR